MGMMRLARMMIMLSVVMASTALTMAPAMAASRAKPHLEFRENRGIGKTYEGAYSGDWTHCNYVSVAKYTQYVNCSKGRTVTESISGNAGFSAPVISGAVGFNVSYSTTVTA